MEQNTTEKNVIGNDCIEKRRKFWLDRMLQIAAPVLESLERCELAMEIPMEFHPFRRDFACLEALGRTLLGLAPWLELEGLDGEEAELQERWRALARTAILHATDPDSPDYMNFSEGYGQALVDAAFLAHAIVRAPKQLYACLPPKGKENLIRSLRATRVFTPCVSNWLLFSAMIETALYVLGEDYDMVRIEYAVRMFENWYVGDGTYSDGPNYHWDYYNSFVIHPMYVDIMKTFRDTWEETRQDYESICNKVIARAARYARIQEQLINADGSYPVFGRSVTYRFGAFQALAQAALQENLPEDLPPSQVRSALTAVIGRVMENPDMFDEKGWLTPGIYGCQPDLAEDYICVGSLYLCTGVFLPLGLAPEHAFWTGPELDWTARKIWTGSNVTRDHAID